MKYNKDCGAFLSPMTAQEQHIKRTYKRAIMHNGRLRSAHAPGMAVRRKHCNRILKALHENSFTQGLQAVEAVIGRGAMNALASADTNGHRGLKALLFACKGACIDMQDFERAVEFKNMADNYDL